MVSLPEVEARIQQDLEQKMKREFEEKERRLQEEHIHKLEREKQEKEEQLRSVCLYLLCSLHSKPPLVLSVWVIQLSTLCL